MKDRAIVIALTLALPLSAHAATESCAALTAQHLTGVIAIAPLTCEPAQAANCAAISEQLVRCLRTTGARVLTPEGTRAVMNEQVLKQLATNASSQVLQDVVGALGANYLAVADVRTVGKASVALVRVVSANDGVVIAASRFVSGDDSTLRDGEVGGASLDQQLGRLAAKLAASYGALGGVARHRLAVLDFRESGALATKNQVGTLVAAELVTRFRRDHGLQLVERSKLQSVLKELELGQTGFVDDKLAPKLGRLLDADALVIGSVSDAGAEVRVNAQIVDVTTGATLVADSVTLPAAGMVALSSDAVVLRSKSGAVFRSLLIPGFGQIYNRQPGKGYALLGSVLVCAGAAVTSEVLGLSFQTAYDKAKPGSNFDVLASRVDNAFLARDIALGVMVAVWVYNVIDAYVYGATFDSATGAPASGGAGVSLTLTPVGVLGRF